MNFSPLVSVILPIYNVKKYLSRGFEQVIAQTYDNFEVLLVDDGSTDGSGELCDELATQHENVFALHKENCGAGLARDYGVEHARGEYVYMCDIDDILSPHLLTYCVEQMERTGADLMMFSFSTVETAYNNRTEEIRLDECEVRSNKELRDVWREKLIFTRNGNGFVWNKFYRRSFLNMHGLRNAPLRIQQDEEFNLRVMRYAKRVYISPKVLYDYYIYERGNNRSRFIADRFDIYKAVYNGFRSLIDFWQISDTRVDDFVLARFYGNVSQCINYNLLHPECPWTHKEKCRELHRIISDDVTRTAMAWRAKQPMNVEARICYSLYKHEQLRFLALFVRLMSLARRVKHTLQ